MEKTRVTALYKFVALPDFEAHRQPLYDVLFKAGIRGTILLAAEGVNGTIAGTNSGMETALNAIRALPGCEDLDWKDSWAEEMPFYRLKVRLKKEIVTMGVPSIDPNITVGTYVDPQAWNDLISDPDTVIIDTRNDYEVSIGTFRNAVNPETDTFREFPDWVRRNENMIKGKKIAMFCTGGIRCEKATAFVKELGHSDVYHLKGGILKYLETVPEETSLWDGECFVFDQRVSVRHGLEEGEYDQCHACKHPISEAEKKLPSYVKGVSCLYCIDTMTDEQRTRFAERQKQIELAKARGATHIGLPREKAG